MSGYAAYFVSDAHLGDNLPYDPRREKWLLDFFRKIETSAGRLFILGDLFDFWIEYNGNIRPDYQRTVDALARLSRNGVKIHYLAGNHDFALGPYLKEQVGINIHFGELSITEHGKRLYLHHGDGLLASQGSYRILKYLLRNQALQSAYKTIFPRKHGIVMGNLCSRFSRGSRNNGINMDKIHAYRQFADHQLAGDYDAVILGHTHFPEITALENGLYCNTGDWITNRTYAVLKKGRFTLKRFHPDAPDETIPFSRPARGVSPKIPAISSEYSSGA